MKTNHIVIVAIMVVVVAGMVVFGTTQKKENKNDAATIAFKTEFMSACASTGQYAYCECAYNAMQKKLGNDGLLSMGLQYEQTNVLPNEAMDAVVSCISKYNY